MKFFYEGFDCRKVEVADHREAGFGIGVGEVADSLDSTKISVREVKEDVTHFQIVGNKHVAFTLGCS